MERQSIAHLRDRLLTGLDEENNVVDPAIVQQVLSQLDAIQVSREESEATRLAKHVNELRKQTDSSQIKAKAKALIKKWRNEFVREAVRAPVYPPPGTAQAPAQSVVKYDLTVQKNREPPPRDNQVSTCQTNQEPLSANAWVASSQ